MKILLQIFITGFLYYSSLLAQSPDTLWTKIFSRGDYNEANSIQQTSDGGYIIIGRTQGPILGLYDIWLIKTNVDGDTLWTKIFDVFQSDFGISVQQSSDGGYILAGDSVFEEQIFLIKTDSNGNTEWTKILQSPEPYLGYSLSTANNGYIIAGRIGSSSSGDLLLIKTDLSGNTLWTKTYGGSGLERIFSINNTNDGGFIITGFTNSSGAGSNDLWLVKTNENGDTLWTRTYGGDDDDRGYSVEQTTDDGYIISGYTESFGAGGRDAWLIRTDENGIINWSKTFGGASNESSYSIDLAVNGFILAGNKTDSGPFSSLGIWIIRTDTNGDTLWTKTLGVDGRPERASQVLVDSDGAYVICGTIDYENSSSIWLIKLDSDVTSVEENPNSVARDFYLHQNYPNPFNPTTKILYQIPLLGGARGGLVTLKVYDVLGNEIATLVDEYKPSGSYEVEFAASGLTSGIYFYQLTSGNLKETKKMILLR